MNTPRGDARRICAGLSLAGVLGLAACGGGSADEVASESPAIAISTRQTAAATTSAASRVVNGDFETPALAAGTYVYGPTNVSGWTFSDSAVLTTMNNAFTLKTPDFGTSKQVVALQNRGEISQTMTINSGDELWFRAIQRQNHNTAAQRLTVLMDGVKQGLLDFPRRVAVPDLYTEAPTDRGWAQYHVILRPTSNGPHTITIRGVPPAINGNDVTAFIDDVQLVHVAGYSWLPVPNGTFEAPVLGLSHYAYRPAGTGWTMTGGAVVAAAYSPFFYNPQGVLGFMPPQGDQVAVLQQNASISQVMSLEPGDVLQVTTYRREDWTGKAVTPHLSLFVNGQKQPADTFYWVNYEAGDHLYGYGNYEQMPMPGVTASGNYTVELRSEVAAPYPDLSFMIDDVQIIRKSLQ